MITVTRKQLITFTITILTLAIGFPIALIIATRTTPVNMAPVNQEIGSLILEHGTDQNNITSLTGEVGTLTGQVTTLNNDLKYYKMVCTNPDVEYQGKIVNGYYPCSNTNPNG